MYTLHAGRSRSSLLGPFSAIVMELTGPASLFILAVHHARVQMYNSQTALMLAAQRNLVGEMKTTQYCSPSRYSVRCSSTYKFTVDDKLSKYMSTQFGEKLFEHPLW